MTTHKHTIDLLLQDVLKTAPASLAVSAAECLLRSAVNQGIVSIVEGTDLSKRHGLSLDWSTDPGEHRIQILNALRGRVSRDGE